MKVTYFYEKTILGDMEFQPKKGFKYGVEISFYDRDKYGDACEKFDYFLLDLMDFLLKTYGHDRERYEFLNKGLEYTLYRVYFRDEADQMAFKIIWAGEWDKEPVYGDEDE